MLLRLAFHDAATYDAQSRDGGANASVQYEFSRPENAGLKRGWYDPLASRSAHGMCVVLHAAMVYSLAAIEKVGGVAALLSASSLLTAGE